MQQLAALAAAQGVGEAGMDFEQEQEGEEEKEKGDGGRSASAKRRRKATGARRGCGIFHRCLLLGAATVTGRKRSE